MNERKRLCLATDGLIEGLAIAVIAISLIVAGGASAKGRNAYRPCKDTAEKMYQSCKAEVFEESKVGSANCINLATREERAECRSEVAESKKEAFGTCRDQRDGRVDACEVLEEYRYDTEPLTNPDLDFVDPDTIDASSANPFLSLVSGGTKVLRAGEGYEETIVIHVTDQTREILGQSCRVVVDIVVLTEETDDGVEYEPVEVTDDWYAQEANGDIYYCGELARNFEDGVLRDLDGSFEAGIDSAKSGLLIKAAPVVGLAHRQEFFLGEAEDIIRYEDLAASVPAEEGGENPLFPCGGVCLKTAEFVPPEPGAGELKYYREGIGFVLGVELEDGEPTGVRDELLCAGDSLDVLSDPACGIAEPEALLEALCKLSPEAFCGD